MHEDRHSSNIHTCFRFRHYVHTTHPSTDARSEPAYRLEYKSTYRSTTHHAERQTAQEGRSQTNNNNNNQNNPPHARSANQYQPQGRTSKFARQPTNHYARKNERMKAAPITYLVLEESLDFFLASLHVAVLPRTLAQFHRAVTAVLAVHLFQCLQDEATRYETIHPRILMNQHHKWRTATTPRAT